MPDVLKAQCTGAAQKVLDSNARNIANTIWAMAKTGTPLPETLEALLMAAAQKVQEFNALELATTLWAMAATGT